MRSLSKAALMLTVFSCLLLAASVDAKDISKDLVVPDSSVIQILTLSDGSTLMGRITEVGEENIQFMTDMGELTVEISKIEKIEEVSESSMKGGKYWFPNPNRTRLLLGPTARSLEAGSGYFFDLWIFFPGIAYAFTDNFMISGGVSIIPGADNQLFYLIPKYSFSASENFDIGISTIIFNLWDETFFLGMGNFTVGSDDRSLTGGLAVAWNEDEIADKPAAMLGGEYRFARRVSLVGESWFIPGDEDNGVLFLGGIRLFGQEIAVDLGIAYAFSDESDEDDTSWLPYIDLVWNF